MSAHAISKTGTTYQLGRHRLHVGDATRADDVAALLGRRKSDMILTDPPYNVGYRGKTPEKLKLANDGQTSKQFHRFLTAAFRLADRHLVPGGAFYVFYPAGRPQPFFGACDAIGWRIRQHLVWVKNHFTLSRFGYHWQHEPCLYGWKSGASHRWFGDRRQSSVLNYPRPSRSRAHPTMKPVAMFARLISNSTAPGQLVLDPFAGSGTTVLAAEETGRRACVLEVDRRYADVIRHRWAELLHGPDCPWKSLTPAIAG